MKFARGWKASEQLVLLVTVSVGAVGAVGAVLAGIAFVGDDISGISPCF